jgi:hypothetical protein
VAFSQLRAEIPQQAVRSGEDVGLAAVVARIVQHQVPLLLEDAVRERHLRQIERSHDARDGRRGSRLRLQRPGQTVERLADQGAGRECTRGFQEIAAVEPRAVGSRWRH